MNRTSFIKVSTRWKHSLTTEWRKSGKSAPRSRSSWKKCTFSWKVENERGKACRCSNFEKGEKKSRLSEISVNSRRVVRGRKSRGFRQEIGKERDKPRGRRREWRCCDLYLNRHELVLIVLSERPGRAFLQKIVVVQQDPHIVENFVELARGRVQYKVRNYSHFFLIGDHDISVRRHLTLPLARTLASRGWCVKSTVRRSRCRSRRPSQAVFAGRPALFGRP